MITGPQRDEYYRERILWRAKQQKLFGRNCCLFSDLPKDSALAVRGVIAEEFEPVFVCWGGRELWTVMGVRAVYSYHDGELVSCDLDEIDKKVSVVRSDSDSQEEVKLHSSFIRLGSRDLMVWAPSGSELFGLMNILLMFPLKKGVK